MYETKILIQITKAKIKDKTATEKAAWEITDLFCSIFLLNHIEKSPLGAANMPQHICASLSAIEMCDYSRLCVWGMF